MKQLRVGFFQGNPHVGDISGNIDKLIEVALSLKDKVDLVITPECFGTGYPIQDLALRPGFLAEFRKAIENLSKRVMQGDLPALLIGGPLEGANLPYNAMYLIDTDGSIKITRKHHLANSEVYDEVRTFQSGPLPTPISFRNWKLGIPICEDVWHGDVVRSLSEEGADIILCPNGSHFKEGKQITRHSIAKRSVLRTGLPFVYLNLVGGQDEIVFDGGSFVMDRKGRVLHETAFEENVFIVEFISGTDDFIETRMISHGTRDTPGEYYNGYPIDPLESIHAALVTGLRDYVNKNHFPGVIIGMSGGIDSALSAVLAVDALGPDRVKLVRLPSKFTSEESMELACFASNMLQTSLSTISIEKTVESLTEVLGTEIKIEGTTGENLQARARGTILMALSNATGYMVLSTGNKSEMTVGYSTLYGDMCGGFNALKGLWKTDVFRLSRWRNSKMWPHALGPSGQVIPEKIIVRPPSAELAPDQTDDKSLGSYDDLDAILKFIIEENMNAENAAISASKKLGRKISLEYALKISTLVSRAEYKRRQAAPGLIIGNGDFDKEWRMPMVNAYGV